MTNATMPDPVAWISHVTMATLSGGKPVTAYPKQTPWLAHGLITTDQAEAYAADKVREALENAAEIADREHFGGQHDDELGWTGCAAHVAHAIRALVRP